MASLFQVMTASTTVGFDTLPIGALSASSLFLLTIVMVIGASPCGTGGGIKTTTVTALWSVMMSVIRGQPRPAFFRREIPEQRLFVAMAGLLFYLIVLCAGTYAVALVDSHALPDQMFECASALGTVGLSRGITATLTGLAQCVIIALMFLGRLGPVAFGVAMLGCGRDNAQNAKREIEDVSL
jgi:trk system potassium uptake protein TrkH